MFFFKQETAYDMRISDWSSDVCSSDLDASDAGMIGRRTSGWNQSWMRDSAYLSGAGEASENIALCSGNSRSCSARARGQSFAAQAAAKSAHSRGATLAVTEMQPAPPIKIGRAHV